MRGFPAVVAVLITGVCAVSLAAEEGARIESGGSATVAIPADFADFWLTFKTKDIELVDGAKKSLGFEDALRKALEAAELSPLLIQVSGVGIPDLNQNVTVVTGKVRYRISRHTTHEDRTLSFAGLCTKMRALGASLDCVTEGPSLGVDEKEAIEQEAVARATENALYHAEAVAGLMESEIFSVQSVSIESVVWNSEPGKKKTHLDASRLTCTAYVKVVYEFAQI